MPIKELMAIASMLFSGLLWAYGQQYVWIGINKFKVAVLHDIGDTRSWGNPSIFQYKDSPEFKMWGEMAKKDREKRRAAAHQK